MRVRVGTWGHLSTEQFRPEPVRTRCECAPMCLHACPHPYPLSHQKNLAKIKSCQNYVVVTLTGNYSWAKCTILDSLVV